MGEVYRARDTRLDREVALKVLPESFARDSDRLRLEQEARAVAALSYPNILAIHDIGEQNGTPFLSELLEGTSLLRRAGEWPAVFAQSCGVRSANCARIGGRPQQEHHPPRSEARKHLHHERRTGEDS
jgi:hypothetical protein